MSSLPHLLLISLLITISQSARLNSYSRAYQIHAHKSGSTHHEHETLSQSSGESVTSAEESSLKGSLIQANEWEDPFTGDADGWTRFIWLIVLDTVACVLCCVSIQCLLSISRKCKGNLANYQRRLEWRRRLLAMRQAHNERQTASSTEQSIVVPPNHLSV